MLLDTELAYVGTEPEEGKAKDRAEQSYGGKLIAQLDQRKHGMLGA